MVQAVSLRSSAHEATTKTDVLCWRRDIEAHGAEGLPRGGTREGAGRSPSSWPILCSSPRGRNAAERGTLPGESGSARTVTDSKPTSGTRKSSWLTTQARVRPTHSVQWSLSDGGDRRASGGRRCQRPWPSLAAALPLPAAWKQSLNLARANVTVVKQKTSLCSLYKVCPAFKLYHSI